LPNLQIFKKSAQIIAKRNVSERVRFVLADFDPSMGHLRVVYCTDSEPTEDDVDDCDETFGELAAEFPAIRSADVKCVSAAECDLAGNEESVVYSRA
jgi:hypothetical protein